MPKKWLIFTILSLIVFYPENVFGKDEEGSRCRPEGVFAPNPSDCNSFLMCNHGKYILRPCQVGIIQDFLYKFGMKLHIDLVEIIIFSLYNLTKLLATSSKVTNFWFSNLIFILENQWNLSEKQFLYKNSSLKRPMFIMYCITT